MPIYTIPEYTLIIGLEGREGPQVREVTGGGSGGPGSAPNLRVALEQGTAKAVAEMTVKALAVSHPVIGLLYAAYQVAQFTYPIVKAGIEEYAETGDGDRALEKMGEETMKQTGRMVVGAAVDTVSGGIVDGATNAMHVSADNKGKNLIKAAVSETINEAIPT